jgi:hypothetical protein
MMSSVQALLFALALALALAPASLARAGAPMPSLSVEVWTPLPLNARIRVELTTTMMSMPTDLPARLKVVRSGKPVVGSWTVDHLLSIQCGSRLRLAFTPAVPLQPGSYEVLGVPPSGPRARHLVTVGAARDDEPPSFAGVKGAYCMEPNPILGCKPNGIGLRSAEVKDASRVRLVTYLRRRGSPYTPASRTEAELLPYDAQKSPGDERPGRYILTQRALDAADNAGGEVCEVELALPAKSSCAGFPEAGPGGKRSVVFGLGSGLIKARCARRDRKGWVSAIDGVRLSF